MPRGTWVGIGVAAGAGIGLVAGIIMDAVAWVSRPVRRAVW